MSGINTWNEPFLPWVESENDRRFKKLLLVTVVVCMTLGAIIPFLPLPEVEQKALKDVSPRLAKLILEKKKKKVVAPKPKAEKKKKSKKKSKKKKPQKKKIQDARKKAERSGLIAMSDELADLRETFNVADLQENKPLQKVGKAAVATRKSAILTARAKSGSGGINTGSLSRVTGESALTGRKSTSVHSTIPSRNTTSHRTGKNRQAARGEEEIESVFQRNKGAIFSLYNRALRRDPTLQGKVVIELTIAPNGRVVKVRIVSSELNNPKLEKKLVARIKMFRFAAKKVSQVTVTYPIDFLPS